VYWFIELKAYRLLKEDYVGPVEISSEGRTYEVCHRAAVLRGISILIVLLGYVGCAWPFLFFEGINRSSYLVGIAMFGLMPVAIFGYVCYSIIRAPTAIYASVRMRLNIKGASLFQ